MSGSVGTLNHARRAIAAAITPPRGTNVKHYDIADSSEIPYPRISVEVRRIAPYQTIGTCNRAEVFGAIVVEVAAGTEQDVSDMLDEYLDPYREYSIMALVMSRAGESPPFGGAVDAFVVTEALREPGTGVAEIPFQFSLTRPEI
jgi:hypothetical protein